MWSCSGRVDADAEVFAYLSGRAIAPSEEAARDLLRAAAPSARLPRWARHRGAQERSRTWIESGHRLLVRVWDSSGELRSVRSWRICDDPTPKRLPPSGYRASGLVLANGSARELLRGAWGPCRIVVVEGEPDWAVWSCRTSDPVLGLLSGSWTDELASKVPFGSDVSVRTHCDDAGEKYARKVIDSLKGRATLRRLQVRKEGEAA